MTGDTFPRVISAVDIGSNTVKVTHARVEANGQVVTLAEVAETIRLGFSIEESGRIASDRIDACLDVLRRQQKVGESYGSTTFAGVATETLRVAINGADLLQRIRNETAWDVRVITGEDEARLTWIGLRDQVPAEGTVLIVDIGGGSTEIIRVDDQDVTFSVSIPLGSGRLADRFFKGDPPGAGALDGAIDLAADQLAGVGHLPTKADTLVFSGGNGTFVDEMIRQLFPGQGLSLASIADLLAHFATTPAADAASRLDIALERARVLPAGAAIALAMLRRVPATTVASAPSGIRTGLIREMTGHSAA